MRLLPAVAGLTLVGLTALVLWPRRAEARVAPVTTSPPAALPGLSNLFIDQTDPDIISPYFRYSEFAVSSAAARAGVPLMLPESAKVGIKRLHDQVLYPLRTAAGRPVRITSGYRSPTVNALVGGSDTSDHMNGQAADINVDGMTGEQAAALILRLGLPFDQLIWYGYTNHVHVGLRPSGNRRQVLYTASKGARPVARTPRG